MLYRATRVENPSQIFFIVFTRFKFRPFHAGEVFGGEEALLHPQKEAETVHVPLIQSLGQVEFVDAPFLALSVVSCVFGLRCQFLPTTFQRICLGRESGFEVSHNDKVFFLFRLFFFFHSYFDVFYCC